MSTPTPMPARLVLCNGAIAAGNTALGTSAVVNVDGLSRLVGNYHCTTAPAAGYPRVIQSVDGVTASITTVLTQDATQPDFQYPVNVAITLPYVFVEWTQGAAPGTLRAFVEARAITSDPSASSSVVPPLPPTPASSSRAPISIAVAGDNTVIAAVVGQTIRIYHYDFVVNNNVTATLKDGAVAMSGAYQFTAGAGMAYDAPGGIYPIVLTAGSGFVINLGGAVQVSGFIQYTQS